MATDEPRYSGVMFGQNTRLSERLLAVAVGLFVLTFLAHTPSDVFPLTFPVGFDLRILVALAAIPPLASAYWNDGFLVSLALAAGPTVGFSFRSSCSMRCLRVQRWRGESKSASRGRW